MSHDAKQVSGIILKQLGGNRFIAMTGAKDFAYSTDENGNPFMVCKFKGSKVANYLRIYLMPSDTYKFQLIKIWGYNSKIVHDLDGVYAEDLQRIFTDLTKLYLTL